MREELAFCAKYGMPRSQFLGGDSLWTSEDRAYALAWMEYEQSQCDGCGEPYEESTHRDNQYAYGGEIIRCHSCAARARTVEKFVNEGGEQAGIMFRMTDKP